MSKLFPPPMDRAEVLHEPSHTFIVWWKITPDQNKLVNPEHFPKSWRNNTHCSRQTTFQFCPLCYSITLRAQRKSVSTSHFWGDSRQRNEFADVGALAPRKTRFFIKFHDFHVPRLRHGKPCPCSNFFLRLWIELRFCMNLATYMSVSYTHLTLPTIYSV